MKISPEALEVRHPMCPVSIRSHEVTQLRYMSDGIVVQTKDLRRSAKLGNELDGFDDRECWKIGCRRVCCEADLQHLRTPGPLYSLSQCSA